MAYNIFQLKNLQFKKQIINCTHLVYVIYGVKQLKFKDGYMLWYNYYYNIYIMQMLISSIQPNIAILLERYCSLASKLLLFSEQNICGFTN